MNKPIPDIVTLTITDLGFGGDGIARDEGGHTVFVPYGLPGDVVRGRMINQNNKPVIPAKRSASRDLHRIKNQKVPDQAVRPVRDDSKEKQWAQIIDVITPSPDRLEKPPCTHCFDCGGCALQHMTPGAYQHWKQQSVLDRLGKAGLTPKTIHPLVAVPPRHRRRATFCARRERGKIIIGFNRHHSDQVIDLHECLVVMPEIFAVLAPLRLLMDVWLDQTRSADIAVTMLDTGLDLIITGEMELNLIKREALAEFVQGQKIARVSIRPHDRAEAEILLGPHPARLDLSGTIITPAPGSFLQASKMGEQALVRAVMDGVGAARRVADLFCGLGTFTFPIAARAETVWAVDADGPGIRAAAAASTGAHKIKFDRRNLYTDPVTATDLTRFDAVVFDPPRAGCKGQGPQIVRSNVPVVVAVSCNPASFVTDCAPLIAAGYEFSDLHVIDQFTWSSHIELVGVFRRF